MPNVLAFMPEVPPPNKLPLFSEVVLGGPPPKRLLVDFPFPPNKVGFCDKLVPEAFPPPPNKLLLGAEALPPPKRLTVGVVFAY